MLYYKGKQKGKQMIPILLALLIGHLFSMTDDHSEEYEQHIEKK